MDNTEQPYAEKWLLNYQVQHTPFKITNREDNFNKIILRSLIIVCTMAMLRQVEHEKREAELLQV